MEKKLRRDYLVNVVLTDGLPRRETRRLRLVAVGLRFGPDRRLWSLVIGVGSILRAARVADLHIKNNLLVSFSFMK